MIPSSTERVPLHTAAHINRKLQQEANRRIVKCAQGGQEAIRRRLTELDQEWDVERALEANAATAALLGLTLGATVDRKWFLFPAFVAGFLLQHAVFGWCPPLPVMRRLGFRTRCEIEQERYALKALRGDFQNVKSIDVQKDKHAVVQAIEATRC